MSMRFLNFARNAAGYDVGIQAEDAHTLIVGQPSAGKSKLLDSIVLEILRGNAVAGERAAAGVVIVDPKQTGFTSWFDGRVAGQVRVYQDLATFSNVYEALVQEHERRTAVMRERGAEKLPGDMGRVYVITDELPSLVSDACIVSKSASASIARNITLLWRLSRQTGIQLISASQTAEGRSVISAGCRGCNTSRVLMKCSNASEVEMTLNVPPGDVNLDNMLPGECYIKTGHLDVFRAWGKYYSAEALAREIAKLPQCDVDFSFLDKRGL